MNVDVQRLLLLDVFVQGQVVQGHGQHPARRHGGNEFRRELDVVALFRLEDRFQMTALLEAFHEVPEMGIKPRSRPVDAQFGTEGRNAAETGQLIPIGLIEIDVMECLAVVFDQGQGLMGPADGGAGFLVISSAGRIFERPVLAFQIGK